MENNASVLVIAPPGRLRDSLIVLLRAHNGLALAGQADNCAEGLQFVRQLRPTLVLLDARLPEKQTWRTLCLLKLKRCHPIALVRTAEQARAARQMGAEAVLSDGFTAGEISETIQTVLST